MFEAKGVFRYEPGVARVVVDQGIADFYRSLIPKSLPSNPTRYPAHISVIRNESPNLELWNKYEGKIIHFTYSNQIFDNDTYYWLHVDCDELSKIRSELGLPPMPWWDNEYHITIANKK